MSELDDSETLEERELAHPDYHVHFVRILILGYLVGEAAKQTEMVARHLPLHTAE